MKTRLATGMAPLFAPICTSADLREIEAAAQAENPSPTLMQRAGLAAADRAAEVMQDTTRSVLVVAGPGNNGGDAFEVALHLKQRFHRVDVLFVGERAKFSTDAKDALRRWQSADGTLLGPFPTDARRRYGLIVDGLFGIGLSRKLEGRAASLVESINASGVPVLALDVPSGINADTGEVMGAAVHASDTITFIALKPGLLTLDGPDHCGRLTVDALGLAVAGLKEPRGHLLDAAALANVLAPRPLNFHKGQAGNAVVLGGASGMTGAALIAGRAALACGAGRVYVGLLDGALPLDPLQPELMLRSANDPFPEGATIAIGPGLGQGDAGRSVLERALSCASPLLVDADALNLIGADRSLAASVAARSAPTLMTPHPAEAARLLGQRTAEVQADRVHAALAMAKRFNAFVALKGNGTVIADARGHWWINSTGHPGMASAGMGDALTGLVTGLLAQGAAPLEALLAAVWLHGSAGDEVAKAQGGVLGTTASDVIVQARRVLNRALRP